MPSLQELAGDNRRREDVSNATYHAAFCIDPCAPGTLHEGSKTLQKEPFKRMSQFDYLREKLRCVHDRNPTDLNVRIHHAVTWLCRPDTVLDRFSPTQ